ncbi:MAG: error-prone DNA polymerase [Limnobacter sp.]|nr:error-prone DNA polymerase [Limnobacter sp.]
MVTLDEIEYAELICMSNFSFLKGASHPEELVHQAHSLGYKALAITDECSLAGIVRAHAVAEKCNLKLIVGSQFGLSEGSDFAGERVVLLVKNAQGYKHLCRLITQARRRTNKGEYQFFKEDLADCPPGLLILLCPNPLNPESTFNTLLRWSAARFSGRLGVIYNSRAQGFDAQELNRLQHIAGTLNIPVLASQDAVMHCREHKPLHDVLTAIRCNQSLHDARHSLEPNAERSLKSKVELKLLYPLPLLANTVEWANNCQFSMNELKYQYPREITPDNLTPTEYLSTLAWQGASERFGTGLNAELRKSISHELALIQSLSYEPYFLTVYDIVRFARSKNILCQGRGSAANSVVCYCLGITEVDPEKTSLLFERFISKERNEPPDIDVDFEHSRREEVIQYIYTKYGRDRAALVAAVVVYRPRSALRDAGKALGLKAELIDALAKSQDGGYSRLLNTEHMEMAGIDCKSPEINRCIHFAEMLLGFPRHLSQHTGGFVIARDTLTELVPVENASMAERTVIQWDKDDLDTMGLLKIDVLALGMLSAIRMTLDALHAKPMAPKRVQEIPKEDPKTYDMISNADTIGVFQIESRAQMGMLPRLRPREYYDLVIQVAIVRPGPIQGGMVHPYLRRRQGLEPTQYHSEDLKKALVRTLGIPIFQEQVMQIAILAAGFTPGEADQLRRGMAAWRRKGGLHQFYERVVGGMVNRGYEREFAEGIFRQMEGFGEYGFPESHAASFALLVYVSAWLKCHHPDAYLCGLLNAQPMGFYQPSQLIRDAQSHGVHVLPVDVQYSGLLSALEHPAENEQIAQQEDHKTRLLAVRLGLNRISRLQNEAAQRIVIARQQQPFDSLEDLSKRAKLGRVDLVALADADALRSLAGHRRQAVWETAGLDLSKDLLMETRTIAENAGATESSTASSTTSSTTSSMSEPISAPNEIENMFADFRATQASLTHHPLQFLRSDLSEYRIEQIATLKTFPNGRLARACGLVTHRQRPATAKGTVFLTLEDETGQINVIVWNDLAEQSRVILRGAQIMGVFGVWQKQGEVCNLLAKRLVDYTPLLAKIKSANSRDFTLKSRDFH